MAHRTREGAARSAMWFFFLSTKNMTVGATGLDHDERRAASQRTKGSGLRRVSRRAMSFSRRVEHRERRLRPECSFGISTNGTSGGSYCSRYAGNLGMSGMCSLNGLKTSASLSSVAIRCDDRTSSLHLGKTVSTLQFVPNSVHAGGRSAYSTKVESSQ